MEETSEMIMEHKEEMMITMDSGSNAARRPAHFLKPSLSSANLPLTTSNPYHQNLPSHVAFTGWNRPLKKWNEWVDKMEPHHQSTWHKARIYHAIMASKNHVRQDSNLVLALAERWCDTTNTFVFPWGEASVTLEDVFVIGGYSVLGESVISPIEDRLEEEFILIDDKLNKVRGKMNKSKSKKVGQVMWMDHFMGNESEIEHEAFLVLWLSRHVFPFSRDVVGRHLHKIAFGLARETSVALAPAVLAYLYQDLSFLKKQIVDCSEENTIHDRLNLWSQMQLVQIWAWERFPSIRPRRNIIGERDLRMSLWNNIGTKSDVERVRLAIDNAAKEFVWRPYTASGKFDFYPENEKWISICSGLQDDYMSFAKFVRVCGLVGLDCIQSYSPHRVSMQFGIDQDIPGKVAYFDSSPEIAWKNFNKLIGDERLYIPSKTYEFAVTKRYLNWWKDSKLLQKNVVEGNDGILCATASGNLQKRKVVEDNTTSKEKKVNQGNCEIRMTRARKISQSKVKMENDQSVEVIELHKISDDDTSSHLVAPQIPKYTKYPPGFEPNETVQMELPNKITKLFERVIGRHDEVVAEHPGEGTLSFDNDDDDEEKVKAACLKKLTDLPLETRISRLENLTAKLKKERLGSSLLISKE